MRDLTGQAEAARREAQTDIPAGATTKQAAAERDGLRLGAMMRERQAAAEAIEQAEAVAAATGQDVDETAAEYGAPRPDGTRATVAEARELLAEAEAARRRFGRSVVVAAADPARMTDRDLWTIGTAAASATAAAINRKAARAARLSDEEYDELRAWLLAEAVSKGAPDWHAIESDADAEAAAATRTRAEKADSLRGRWIGWLILRGRQWRAERAERMAAESAPEETIDVEAVAAAETAAATATVEAVAVVLADAGRPLGKAERVALLLGLMGLSRREAAERLGMKADDVKRYGNRGRHALAERWPNVAAARRDLEAAGRAALAADGVPEAEFQAAARELLADGWARLQAARPLDGLTREAAPPRRGRGLLPPRPRPIPLAFPWHAREAARLAAAEMREAHARQGFPLALHAAAERRASPEAARPGRADRGTSLNAWHVHRAAARAKTNTNTRRRQRAAQTRARERMEAARAIAGYAGDGRWT